MIKLQIYCVVLLIFFVGKISAQVEEDIRMWASEIIENMAADAEEEGDYSFLLDELVRLSYSPIAINQANREDLEAIPFLTDQQIEALLFRRYQLGSFNSIFDLQMVEGLDQQTIEWLAPLLLFDKLAVERRWKYKPKGDLFVRAQSLIEKPLGYQQRPDGETPYQGDRLKLYSRLQIRPLQNVELGLVTEKDPGEAAFTKEVKTMDFANGYISWAPKGFIKQIIVGQYRMRAGQGLVLQTSMPARKSSMATSIRNRYASYRPSLSVAESGGMKGAMVAMGNSAFTITPFFSYQKRDATLSEDKNGKTIITSLKTDGYHRTLTEITNRRTTDEWIYGGQLKYYLGRFIIDVGHLKYKLEYPLIPKWQPYNHFYFSGDHQRNSWLAADGTLLNVHLFSEVAYDYSAQPAVWSGLSYVIGGHSNLALAYRRIPKDFSAPLGAPLTESGNPSGEAGVYIGLESSLPGRITLATYLDYFEYSWLKFQAKAPSNGYDFLAEIQHRPSYGWENTIRYRHKEKSVNQSVENPSSPIVVQKKDQFRLQTRFSSTSGWRFTTRVDFNWLDEPGKDAPVGVFLSQDVRFKSQNGKWTWVARYAVMDTQEYETRVYAYEPDVLYGFSIPAYYGQGTRWLAMVTCKVLPSVEIWIRYARWDYTDREKIGSGNNTIESNVSNEVKMQVRWKF